MRHFKFSLSAFVVLYVSEIALSDRLTFENRVQQLSTTIVDKILLAYKQAVIASGNFQGVIRLDDIKINISLPFVNNQVRIWATNGSLQNVLSLYRSAPVEMDYLQKKGVIALRSELKLDFLYIDFKNFQVDFPLVHKNASIDVDVDDTVYFAEVVVEEHPCRAYLNEMKIISIKDAEPRIKGLSWSILDEVAGKILKAFLDILFTMSKSTLEKYFRSQVEEAVNFTDICGTIF